MKLKGKVLGKATTLILTRDQCNRLRGYTTGQGGYQSLCQRVYENTSESDGKLVARVYEKDMERIRKAGERPDHGSWQDLFREILDANK